MTTATPVKNYWKLKGCPKCKGDILVAAGDSRCLQCGYDSEAATYSPLDRVELQAEIDELIHVAAPKRRTTHVRLLGAKLAARNFQVQKMAGDGCHAKQIAEELSISVSYVYILLRGMR